MEFTIRHLGISKVRGRFNAFDASFEVGDTLEASRLQASVDLATVDTNNADRDAHLQSTDFFNTEANPQMTFESTSIIEIGDGAYALTGNLSLNGITEPTELAVEFNGAETYPMDQKVHAGFSAKGTLSRKRYGVDFDLPLGSERVALGDNVTVELEMQLIQPE